MNEKNLSTMEIDAIGEILNISLGASATAVSTMLDARVDITTPVVRVVKKEDFFLYQPQTCDWRGDFLYRRTLGQKCHAP